MVQHKRSSQTVQCATQMSTSATSQRFGHFSAFISTQEFTERIKLKARSLEYKLFTFGPLQVSFIHSTVSETQRVGQRNSFGAFL